MNVPRSQKPIIIPELLKELVHRQIEINPIFKNKINEKNKLIQRLYLIALKLIKSHIVSGIKESSFENPLEDAQELLLMNGKSAQLHKLNTLYDKLSDLSLTIPELSYVRISNKNSSKDLYNSKFEDKILRLLLPLYQTELKPWEQENIHNINNHITNNEHTIINRSKESDSNFELVNKSNSNYIQKTSINHFHKSEITPNHKSSIDQNSNSLYVLEKCLITPSQELALVHDILYALQGYEAQFIKYDISKDEYIILPSVYCLQTTREIVTEICHIGTLFKRMNLILENMKHKFQTNYFKYTSFLTKTLIEHTHEILADYSQFIISLQNEVQDTMISLSKLDPGINPNYELLYSNCPMLTLRKLLHRMNDQYMRKEKVFAVLEGLFGMSNSSILSGLYLQQNTGNQYHKQIFEQIFKSCILVWIQDLNMIIKYGFSKKYSFDTEYNKHLNNEFNEFFIKGNLVDGLKIDVIHIPIFIQTQIAQKITNICETRIIIKSLLSKDEDSQLINKLNIPDITFDLITDLNQLKLNYHLTYIQKLYNKELIDLIVNNGSLIDHFKQLRDFYLCFKGDYWDYLIHAMFDELEKPCNQVSIQNLNDIFDNSKTIFFRRKKNLHYFNINIQNLNPDSTGWDIFSLNYKFDKKIIEIILTKPILKRYEKIFRKIWKYNYVIKKLNDAWINLIKYLRTNELCLEEEHDLDNINLDKLDILRQSSCLIRSIILSINIIKNLLIFDSINYLWNVLKEKIPNCSSVEEIINFHNLYLKSIESNLFIIEEKNNEYEYSKSDLKIIRNLFFCSDLLLETGLYICKVVNTMITSICIDYYESNRESVIKKLLSEIFTCSENFKNCIKSFLDNLTLYNNERQGKYLGENGTLFQLDLFKILLNELQQLNFVRLEVK